MAQEQATPLSNGDASPAPAAEPQSSLRDIAEAAWDEVQDAADQPEAEPTGERVDDGGQRRDALGRFAPADPAAKPGEQSHDPAPKIDAPGEPKPVDPALGSNQPPQHWPEQDRQLFAKQTPEAQAFLLRRHTEMERDYQGKAQASATAVQFTQSLAPIFQHPAMAGSLQQSGVSPFEAIGQWATFHLRFMDPDPRVAASMLRELAERRGLNPAAIFGQMSQSGPGQLSEDDLKDPAIKYFADHVGRTFQDVQALRGELHQMRQQEAQKANAEVLKVTRWQIDQFGDEKDAAGNRKRPYFDDDQVMRHMMELFHANPERDLQQTYDAAVWSVPSIREKLIAAERSSVQQQQGNERARQAVRSNVRGITSPVTKPAGEGKATGLRATLEQAADEVGL